MNKKKLKKALLIILSIILIIVIAAGAIGYKLYRESTRPPKDLVKLEEVSFNKDVKSPTSLIPMVYVLNKSNEKYETIKKYFYSAGFDIMQGNIEEYINLNKNNSILVIPEKESNSLNAKEVDLVLQSVKEGKNVIFYGKASLNEKLGIITSKDKINIDKYVWESHKDVNIKLKNKNLFNKFTFKDKNLKTLASYNNLPLVVCGEYGKGKFIYSGMPLWLDKGEGYEISPYLIETVAEEFKIKPQVYRKDLAAYVNINFFISEKPETVAERTFKAGISQLNISGWTTDNKDYTKKLIEECHKRGIAAYIWLEFPMVSTDFWNKHPEWREQTASGKEAQIDWRYLMALEDPNCFKAIEEYLVGVLKEFDWDGVDIAEIYFESPGTGIKDPFNFTPMHDSFRNRFKDKYGVDPKDILLPKSKYYWAVNDDMKKKLLKERVELITELNEKVLKVCDNAKKDKPYLKTMVTVIDSLLDKRMEDNIGVSAKKLVELQNKYDFILQIEDPYTLWAYGPHRYKIIGESYKKLMEKDKKLAIDINFVDRYGEAYPTKKQRGAEIIQLIYNANLYTDQVTFYAIETMVDSDMKLVPFVRRDDIKIKDMEQGKYSIESDKKFSLALNTEGKQYFVDGKPWPFVNKDEVILPKGKYLLEEKTGESTKSYIESISGELVNGELTNDGMSFDYESNNRCYVVLKEKPNKIIIDNEEFNTGLVESSNILVLPQGKHKVNLKFK